MIFDSDDESTMIVEPNLQELRQHGWAVNRTVGRYCYAWRGQEEALFVWRGSAEGWMQIPGRGRGRQAA